MSRAVKSDPTVRLNSRPRLYADESILGYLLKAAGANDARTTTEVAARAGIQLRWLPSLATVPTKLRALPTLLGQPADALLRATYWPAKGGKTVNFLGHQIGHQFVTTEHRRYCPACLKENGRHRAVWDLSISTACVEHGRQLQSRCPKCEGKLGWTRGSSTRCHCGGNLLRAKANKVLASDLVGLRQLQAILTGGRLPKGVPDVSVATLMDLCLQLGALATGMSRRPRPIRMLERGMVTHLLVNAGWQVCQDWPRGIHALFEQLQQGAGGRNGRYGIVKSFGRLSDWMVDRTVAPETQRVVREALEDYLDADETIRFRTRKVSRNRTGKLVTLTQAKKRLNRSVVRVGAVLKKHKLVEAWDGGGSGAAILVQAAVVERLRGELEGLVDRKGARRILRVSRMGLAKAEMVGWLWKSAGSGPAAELFGRPSWKADGLESLVDLFCRACGANRPPDRRVRLSDAISSGRFAKVDFEPKSLPRHLNSAWVDEKSKGLARIVLNVDRLVQRPQPSGGALTIPEAAIVLKVKQEVAYHLCRQGLLKTHCELGVNGQLVSSAEMKRFRETYVFPSQLGLDAGRHRGWAATKLMATGCKPVSGPGVDGGRQFVFRRTEKLERVLKLHAPV
ncbi:MAG: TniQ family protein [Ferrovibrio sp.]|uniref:TniQ family protein n=1 Tax=Ferrovibrio sp. TaxID=1917215 RepID=UPI00262983EE|nr:TniQ family protein [Ferrovibrio sp.]MCW0236300.1 TniQ family protein [Ferrovibrio sp.]